MAATLLACADGVCRCHACRLVLSPPLMICRRCNPEPSSDSVQPAPTYGPGTELKKLLSRIGITSTPNCKCTARVKHMDAMEKQEPGWCAANIDTVVGYLREAAADRGLPFLDAAGRVLVRRAISNARKEAARATQATTAEGSEAAV
jgi:hypothetical protein